MSRWYAVSANRSWWVADGPTTDSEARVSDGMSQAAAETIAFKHNADLAAAGYCNIHGQHLGDECPECPYEDLIDKLRSEHEAAVGIIRRLVEWPITNPTAELFALQHDGRAFLERKG